MVWLFLLFWLACSHVRDQVGDLEAFVVDLRISLAVRIIARARGRHGSSRRRLCWDIGAERDGDGVGVEPLVVPAKRHRWRQIRATAACCA